MSLGIALLLLAPTMPAEAKTPEAATRPAAQATGTDHFTSYTEAYRAARKAKRPMIVILNPPKEGGVSLVSLEDVQKTQVRRDLLGHYVVAVVDTGTPHGKKVHEIFGSPQLPRVVVIDNEQAMQVYRTSEALYGQMWDKILEVFQEASPSTRMPTSCSPPGSPSWA